MRFTLAAVLLAAAIASGSAVAGEQWVVPAVARACPQHGPGFVRVAGSATCVKVGGRVTADTTVGTRRVPRESIAGFGASGRVSLDSRTDTELGPLRTYVRVRAGDRTGRRD